MATRELAPDLRPNQAAPLLADKAFEPTGIFCERGKKRHCKWSIPNASGQHQIFMWGGIRTHETFWDIQEEPSTNAQEYGCTHGEERCCNNQPSSGALHCMPLFLSTASQPTTPPGSPTKASLNERGLLSGVACSSCSFFLLVKALLLHRRLFTSIASPKIIPSRLVSCFPPARLLSSASAAQSSIVTQLETLVVRRLPVHS
jgi:hypothetical protein